MAIIIKINGLEANVIRKSIKNIYLKICPSEAKVKISAPIQMSLMEIQNFLLSKLDWIKNKQNWIKNKQKKKRSHKFINNESHFFRGKKYKLKIVNNESRFVKLNNDEILLHIQPESNIEERMSIINQWYKDQLLQSIPPLIKKWEKILNVSVEKFFIRKMKTRWGSCTPNSRRIRFNLELAKASPDVLEYIIVHELVHLIEASHNRKFKNLMDLYYPKWKNIKKELNQTNFIP